MEPVTKDEFITILNRSFADFAVNVMRPMIKEELKPIEQRVDDLEIKVDTLMATIGEHIAENNRILNGHEFRIGNLERSHSASA